MISIVIIKDRINFRIIFISIIILLYSAQQYLNGSSSTEYKKKLSKLPYEFSTIAEYNPITSTFFGRKRINKKNYFISINSKTSKIKQLNILPSFKGWVRGASTIDIKNQKLFFIAVKDNFYYLSIVDIKTGKTVKSIKLSHSVKNIEFDTLSNTIYGISHFDIDKFISIDQETGKINEVSELRSINSTSTGAMIEGNKFYFIGNSNGKSDVFTIDIKTGLMKPLKGIGIGLNEYHVKSLKKTTSTNMLFTSGVQSCTAIAGYETKSGIGFIVHFSPNFKNIDKILSEIIEKIKSINKQIDFKNMNISVVGGIRGNIKSMNNFKFVYKELVEKYGVDYKKIIKFSTGVSHNIMIYKGKINLF